MPRQTDRARIAEDIKRRIRDGEYQPGDRLPAGRLLAQRYEVSMQPVKAAIDDLERDGWLEGQQGKAVFVLGNPHQAEATPG